MTATGPILICYDGSESARAALEAAAEVFAPRSAVVVCYWEPFASGVKRFGVHILELVQDAESINERENELAQQIAAEGSAAANAAGLSAEALASKIEGPIEEAILLQADEIDAVAIVLGARSRSTIRSLILGDIANEVVQRATRPVFLTPSAALVERRREALQRGLEAQTPH
jgi:nucleotide-binding universal stress UspA family protein